MTREEAIGWLELLSKSAIGWDDHSEENAHIREESERRVAKALNLAIEALKKVQEPRVLSLDELVADDVVWLEDCDKDTTVPGIYCDSNDTNTIFATRMKGYLNVLNDEYGKRWRCWSSRPTIEQMRATPWP